MNEQSKQSREMFLTVLENVLGHEDLRPCIELFREMDYGWWGVGLGNSYVSLHWKDPDNEDLLNPRGWSLSADDDFPVNRCVAKELVLQLWDAR